MSAETAIPKADKQATEARKFVESKSHVTKDGREVLHRLDWKRRVKELDARCGGRCEYIMETAEGGYRCGLQAAHPHHKIKRSKGRDDRLENLIALCVPHHREMHPEKQIQRVKR